MKKYLLSLFAMLAVALGANAADVTDVLNNAWTGVTGTTYTEKTGLTATSDAVYSIQCAGGNTSIQLRSNGNNSGIVTTESGGTAKTLKVTWNSNTAAARVLQVYGSDEAYDATTDLYDTAKQGTLIGEISTTATELDLKGYEYIGIRSKSGALYLDEIQIIWTTGSGVTLGKPQFDPAGTSFAESVEVTITHNNTSGSIYYTLDGTDPTAASTLYEGPITVTETTTVKAIVSDGTATSSVASATYTKLEMWTIADVQAADAGTSVYVEGAVVAAGDAGIVIYDGTDYLYCYAGSGNTIVVGDKVRAIGTTTTYGGARQLPIAAVEVIGTEEVTHPSPVILLGEDLEKTYEDKVASRIYVTYQGTLTISGNYYNIAVEGTTTAVGSIIKPFNAEQYADLNGKEIVVTGYQMYVNSKYVYTIATSIEEVMETFTITMADDVENGMLVIDPEVAAAGDIVAVTAVPAEGYVLESIVANGVNTNQEVILSVGTVENEYTFEMIADDVVVIPVFAEEPQPVDFSGKYYVRNVLAYKYWGAGNDWGTQASLVDEQQYVTFAKLADGTYSMETMVSNGGTNYYFGGDYMDGAPISLTITPQEGNGYVTISNGTNYYGYNGQSTVLGKNMSAEDRGALWQLLTQEEIDAENAAVLATATQENPVDATFLIKDPFFSRNRREANEVWNNEGNKAGLNGGGNGDNNAESYMQSFSIQQTLAGAPAGVYKLTANAAVTYHDNRAIKEWDGENAPQVFMNEETADFFEMEAADRLTDRATLRRAFDAGKYKIDPLFVEVGDGGNLVVGALSTRADIWAVWDTFELSYYGPDADITEVKFGDLVAVVERLRALAEEQVANDNMPSNGVDVLSNALTNTETIDPTEEAYNAAIEELTIATNLGTALLHAADVLPKMRELTERNNVVAEGAVDTYYTQWQTKFDNGEMSEAEALALRNPFEARAWNHDAGVDFNNYLLSAWADANAVQLQDFIGALYINNWSVEGNNDDSNVYVPFYEYWTGDGNSLGATTWTATLPNLAPGNYTVSAVVRVRQQNGTQTVAPTGITMQVNDGEAVDVTTGRNVKNNDGSTSQFFVDTFTATGTVGDDGVLTFKFIIADGNNISWLSFQDVQYAAETFTISIPDIEGATVSTDPEGEAAAGQTVTIYVDPEEGFDVESVQVLDVTGAPAAEVLVADTEYTYTFTMPATDVFVDVTVVEAADPNDYTGWIINADLTSTDPKGFDDAGTKSIDGTGVVKVGSGATFDFKQTIHNLPAGEYRLTAQAAYRYSGSEEQEYSEIQAGNRTKLATLYATVGDETVETPVMNRWDGASETDYANGSGSKLLNGLYVPNSSNAVKAWFDAGQYVNEISFVLTEDGDVTIGIVKTESPDVGDYTVLGPWTLYRTGEANETDIIVERYTGLGYTTTTAEVDFTAAKKFLGVDEITTDMLWVVNPDGTEIKEYAPYDGWFNGEGVAETWGDNTKINVKFFEAIPNGTFSVCDMNGADEVGSSYTVNWALKANEKTYTYHVTVQFIEPEQIEIEISDNIFDAGSVEYFTNGGSYIEKFITLSDDIKAAVAQEAGVDSFDQLTVYGYNPSTEELVAIYAGYDGWRAANGDFAYHSGNSEVPICVKYTDGTSFPVYSINDVPAGDYFAYWAFATDTKAVLVRFTVTYVEPEVPEITYSDLNIVGTEQIDITLDAGTYFQGATASVDMATAFSTLGAETLNDVVIYAVVPDGTLDSNYGLGSTDGWRNKEGNWQSYGDEAYYYVKADFTRADNQIYEVGTYPDKVNAYLFTTKYVFVKANTNDAYEVDVVITYGDVVGIDGIFADKNAEKTIFDLSGRRVNTITKGGLYIINGKKVLVK